MQIIVGALCTHCFKKIKGDMNMNFNVCSYSDKGDRGNNEDAVDFFKIDDELIAVVADGLGGYKSGEIASGIAVTTLAEAMQKNERSEEKLLETIGTINTKIIQRHNNEDNMMSTIAVLWILPENMTATAVNVGDTRIYQFRDGKVIFQSVDHSVAQMAVLVGEIEKSEIRTYNGRNKLIRALGSDAKVKAECEILDVREKDCFLLCSDGFWELVTEENMINTLQKSSSSQEWLNAMQDFVESSDNLNKDNNSAVVIMIE